MQCSVSFLVSILLCVACSHNTETIALHTPAGYAAPQDMQLVASAAITEGTVFVPVEPAERIITSHRRHHRRHHNRHHRHHHRRHHRRF
ncbi:MAG: hypothetical protein HYR96_10740 [Deltaproteobacteria bacterium]|nr:hypothetical protein [Deltaproteobacteria bacterium]MBI3293635.1 hypothetical protein [Deltaproteobacteria bacterium]